MSLTVDDGGGPVATDYVWDVNRSLPVVLQDGTNTYVYGLSLISATDGSGDPTYLLDDALGSVRGVTDDSGALTGSADYSAFGSLRTGDAFALSYTGEQTDPSTGLTYLRARYLNPAVGRFISADTVSPNAPGTQGYNGYAYVGNNPETWADPTGRSVGTTAMAQLQIIAGEVLSNPTGIMLAALAVSPVIGVPLVAIAVGFPVLICALTAGCADQAIEIAEVINKYGSKDFSFYPHYSWGDLEDAISQLPKLPSVIEPIVGPLADCVMSNGCRLIVLDTIGVEFSVTSLLSCSLAATAVFGDPVAIPAGEVCAATLLGGGAATIASVFVTEPPRDSGGYQRYGFFLTLTGCTLVKYIGAFCQVGNWLRDVHDSTDADVLGPLK